MDKSTLNKRQERLYNFKIFAICIPILMAIIAVVAMIIITTQVFRTDISLKVTYSLGITAGLSVIAIAFTMWVGLNIYNIVERSQVDALEERAKNMIDNAEEKLSEIEKQIDLNAKFSNVQIKIRMQRNEMSIIEQKFMLGSDSAPVNLEDLNLINSFQESVGELYDINAQLRTPYLIDSEDVFLPTDTIITAMEQKRIEETRLDDFEQAGSDLLKKEVNTLSNYIPLIKDKKVKELTKKRCIERNNWRKLSNREDGHNKIRADINRSLKDYQGHIKKL